ncbi:arabinan endo-1,5-alpha-L-arabinosidase [bacterium]|nr:arabinan endo-1,5-alpha-L-arabinosidase [bacterium]
MRLIRFIGISVTLLLSVVLSITAAENNQVDVHDPAMAKEGDTYYLFSSGPGITTYSSGDMKTWTLEGRIFPDEPSWARRAAPGFNTHIWAPDVLKHDGRFYLYYSVSAFGRNTSAIGLTINRTLDRKSPDYQWVDQGIIVQSVPNRDLWNGIDSTIELDEQGNPWMAFGSWWSGIKLVRLDETWTRLAEPQEWHAIAKRDRSVLVRDTDAGPAAIEGPFLFKKGEYYYLFVSTGLCCRGRNSTYRMEMGRSKDIRGPYLDKEGRDMAQGGGSDVITGNERWAGWGGNSAYTIDGRDFMVFHAYENADNDYHRLKIGEITWDAEQWPVVDEEVLDAYTGYEVK